jgi:OmpA-OmpF porin, OOP family
MTRFRPMAISCCYVSVGRTQFFKLKLYFYGVNVRLVIFFIAFCQQFNFLLCQNLVKNPGFEETKYRPFNFYIFSDITRAKYWKNTNLSSPDFHENHKVDKFLQLGESHADSGRYFVGIMFERESYEYYEYIETKLKENLIKDKLYCFEISILFSSTAPYCVDNLQFALSEKFLKGNKHKPLVAENVVTLSNGLLLNNPIKYTRLSSVYAAKGGEQYLTIGEFNRDAKYYAIEYIKNRNAFANRFPYYFFDNVVLRPIKDSSECPCFEESKKRSIKHDTVNLNEISPNKTYRNAVYNLTQVNFKTNSSVLPNANYSELDSVVAILKRDNSLKINVSGHTDVTGIFLKNFELSEKRAKSVADYIIKKGVEKDRVKFEGFGSSKPIGDNETEQGRAINRRVEIAFE